LTSEHPIAAFGSDGTGPSFAGRIAVRVDLLRQFPVAAETVPGVRLRGACRD